MKKLLLVLSLWSISSGICADGGLDTTFGSGAGYITGPATFLSSGITIQPDGKIIVAGSNPSYNISQIIRYNNNGTIDNSFGSGGSGGGVVLGYPGIFFDVLVQPNGLIVAGGQDNAGNFQLARYLQSGAGDYYFNFGGVVVGPSGFCSKLALQTDEYIIAAGSNNSDNVFVVRYNPNGGIDTIFDAGPSGYAKDVKIQNDGRIVTVGPDSNGNFQIVRFNSDGTLDTSFGTSGVATGPAGVATSLLIQPDGKLVVGGSDLSSPTNTQIARFNSDGTPDSSFSTGGSFVGSQGIINEMALQENGSILVVGNNAANQIQLARYSSSGVLDLTFGLDGVVSSLSGSFSGIALQENGFIVVVGLDSSSTQMQVARFSDSNALEQVLITGPLVSNTGTITFSGTAQNPSNIYLFLDGSYLAGTVTDSVGLTNTWSYTTTISTPGTYLLQAAAVYEDGNVNSTNSQILHIYG